MNNDEQQPSTSHLPSNQRSAQSPPRWPDGDHRNHSTHRYHPYHQHDHPVHQASTSMYGHGSNYTQRQHEQQPSTSRFPLNQPRTQSPSQWHPNRNLLSSSMMQPQIYERISSFPPTYTGQQQAAQNPTFDSSQHHQLRQLEQQPSDYLRINQSEQPRQELGQHHSPIFYPQQTRRPEYKAQASTSMYGQGSNHTQHQQEHQPSISRFSSDQPSTQSPRRWHPTRIPLHPSMMLPQPHLRIPSFPPPITGQQQAAQNSAFDSSQHHQLRQLEQQPSDYLRINQPEQPWQELGQHHSPIFYPQQTRRPEYEVQDSIFDLSRHHHHLRQLEQQPSDYFRMNQPEQPWQELGQPHSTIIYPQQTGRREHEVQASTSMHRLGSNYTQRQHEQQPATSRFPLNQPRTQPPSQWHPRTNPLHPPIMQPPPQQNVPGSWIQPFSHLHAQEPNYSAHPHEKQNQFQPLKFQSYQLPSSFSHPQNCVPRIPHLQGFSSMAFLPHEAYRYDAVASQLFQPGPQSETRHRAESKPSNYQSTNMQSSNYSNLVSDNQIQDSNLIQGIHGNVNIKQNQYNVTQQHQHDEVVVSDEDGKKAIAEVLKCQERYLEREGDLHFQGSGLCQDNIPIVHPSITEINFYGGELAKKVEKYEPSSINDSKDFHRAGNTKFKDILRNSGTSRLISIVGIPGAGKTILSKRLVRSGNKKTDRVWFHKKFMNMDYKSEKLTVRELFFDKSYPELDKKTSFNAFAWVKKNGHKCTFVFDGLDQAEFKLNEKPPEQDYDTPCKVEDLFSNLCCGHYLSRSDIIITSRPHSLLFLTQNMRPVTTYQLDDLAFHDMKTLFWAYAGGDADELWRKLNSEARHLLRLCRNPLLLQLVISAGLDPSSKVGEMFTLTRLFESLKDNLKYSKNVQDVEILMSKELLRSIAKLAYRATSKGTVVITVDQLKDVGLDPSKVHDIIVQLFTCKDFTNCFRVFDGNTRLYFSHQSFQEYFAAYHIVYNMMKDEFEKFVEERLFKDHWAVVRRFVCGFLLDLEANSKTDLEEKTEILKTNLIQQLTISSEGVNNFNSNLTTAEDHAPRLLDLYACVGEGKDSSIATKAAEHFPTTIQLPQPINSNLVPGFCFVMKHVTKQLDVLSLAGCSLDANSFHEIASVIKKMKPGQIGEIDIGVNLLQPSNTDDVIGLLRVVRDENVHFGIRLLSQK
ncbi:uncharacterized protein LOC143458976 isoform X1 [Clavelina lepadiformis]|uniref:uncharacterized protein LOC143458976 isoform X1 n=2 Tax=Clavelina lepadiformis TaxID=159417 RepID=UPI0040426995